MRNHFLKVGRGKLGNASIVGSSGSNILAGGELTFAADCIPDATSGDVAIIFGFKDSSSTSPANVSGWTRMYTGTDSMYAVFIKTLTSSDVSFTGYFGSSQSGCGIMVVCRGCDAANITGATIQEYSAFPNPPSVSGFEINDLCLAFGAYAATTAFTLNQTSGYTLVHKLINTMAPQVSIIAESKKITTAGADDPPSFTGSGTPSVARAVTLRLPSL